MSPFSESPNSGRPQVFQPPQGDLAVLHGSGNPLLAQSVANELGVSLVPCRAMTFSEGNVFVQIKENVRGRNVILVDDFTITARTLTTLATALKDRGAKDIYAAVTHGALSEGVAAMIGESCIRKMFMTDTIESLEEALPDNFEILPVAPIFAHAIRSIHERTSVSLLFANG